MENLTCSMASGAMPGNASSDISHYAEMSDKPTDSGIRLL
jgi:hypothetical protein